MRLSVTLAEGARVRVAQRDEALEPRDHARLLAHLARHGLGELLAWLGSRLSLRGREQGRGVWLGLGSGSGRGQLLAWLGEAAGELPRALHERRGGDPLLHRVCTAAAHLHACTTRMHRMCARHGLRMCRPAP